MIVSRHFLKFSPKVFFESSLRAVLFLLKIVYFGYMIKENLERTKMGEKEFLSALNDFRIPEISEDTKFWMIRTKKDVL